MPKQTRTMLSLVTAGALLAAPAAALASKRPDGNREGHANKRAQSCAKTRDVGFVVAGTLVSFTADDPATAASEATVTLTVMRANRPAKRSGDIADQDATKPGVQAKGATYTVAAGDAFNLRLKRYQGTDTPSAGDRVIVRGSIARTKPRCAPAGTSVADLFGAVDVRRVTIADRDPDA